MEKKNKKGDISAATLIGVILLVIGFGIVLVFVFRVYYSGNVDREVCKESVTLRAIASGVSPGFAQKTAEDFVDLVCKTQKKCITAGIIGGRCDENFGSEKVTKVKVKSETQVEKAIADEIISCWDMMGKGRLSLFSPGWTARYGFRSSEGDELNPGSVYSSCIICSRIAFDLERLENRGVDLSELDVYDYMLKHKMYGKDITYAEYIGSASPAGVSLAGEEDMQKIVGAIAENVSEEGIEITKVDKEDLPKPTTSDELAIVFVQIKAPGYWHVLRNVATDAAIAGAGAAIGLSTAKFAFPPLRWLASGATKLIGLVGAAKAAIVGAAVLVGALVVQGYNVYSNAETAFGHCGDIEFEDGEDYGCSAVRAIYYDADNLKRICGVIESTA